MVTYDDLNAVFDFVCDFWTDSGAAFGNSLRDLFVKTISLICKIRTEEDQFSILSKWTDRILKFPKTLRVVYFAIEILAKHVGGNYILNADPGFVDQAFNHMGSNALANPLGKAVFSIYRSNKDTMSQEEWIDLWSKPTYRALSVTSKPSIIHHVQTYFLELMFKVNPATFSPFIGPLYEATDKNDEQSLSILVGCMKIGQDLSIDVSTTIGPELIQVLLKHSSGNLRVGGLSLLVSSPQVSRPVKTYVYELLKENMDNLLVDADAGYRNKVFGYLRQFTFRIRSYAYASSREMGKLEKQGKLEEAGKYRIKLEEVNSYCQWYLSYLNTQLQPGTPYHGLFAGTKLLSLLVQSGLDQDVDSKYHEKQHISFPFHIKIFQPELVRLLVDNMTNNYEDIRTMSSTILKMAPKPLCKLENEESVDRLAQDAKSMVSGMRGREGDGGSRVIGFVFQLYDDDKSFHFLNQLLKTLEREIDFAKHDLALAVREHSIHGYFTSLRMIFEIIDFKNYKKVTDGFIDRIMKAIVSVWDLVKSILSHDSPEGNLPEELESNYEPELEAKYGPATQVILSYSWRAVKEAAALLQTLINKLPDHLLSDEMIVDAGNVILTQLATVRHRGAFSSVYPTFVSCCRKCNSRSTLQSQSGKWLDENLDLVQTKAQFITRRSGGLPFLVTAIITAAAENNRRTEILNETFDKLVDIAYYPATKSSGKEKVDLPQVHAFNCIKTIFVESELSNDSAPLIDRALKLAISSFSSDIWAIRNCAVMLFTALQNRLFGAKFDKRISARLFFTKYRSIKPVLLEHLMKHVKYLDSVDEGFGHHVETVYPVLSLLARLEGVSGFHGLDDFKPLIMECLKSRIWKIREMAARTLNAFVTTENVYNFCIEILAPATISRQNELHGRCLALQNISSNFIKPEERTSLPEALIKLLETKFKEVVSQENPSPDTQLAYYRVMKAFNPEDSLLLNYSNQLPPNTPVVKASARMFRDEVARTLLESSFNSNKKDLLDSCNVLLFDYAYEVQLSAIKIIEQRIIDNGDREDLKPSLASSLWQLFETSNWDQVRGPCVRLFSKLCDKDTLGKYKESYWNSLYSSIGKESTEEINEASIESLGFIAAKMDKDITVVSNWLGLIRKFANENEEFPTRLAALKSLRAFLENSSSLDTDDKILTEIYFELLFFLSDDDFELRGMAADFTSNLLQIEPCTSVQAEYSLVNHLKGFNGFSQIIIDLFRGIGPLESQINEALDVDEVLFTVEKQNLFRNQLSQLKTYYDFLIEDKLTESFLTWANNGVQALKNTVRTLGKDGLLGWTSSNPDLYFIILRVLYTAKCAGIDMGELRELMRSVDFHEFLLHAYA